MPGWLVSHQGGENQQQAQKPVSIPAGTPGFHRCGNRLLRLAIFGLVHPKRSNLTTENAETREPRSLILLKNPTGQKATVKRTISDVSLGHSNRVQTKLARKNFQHFSYIFTHLQNRGVLQQNQVYVLTQACPIPGFPPP